MREILESNDELEIQRLEKIKNLRDSEVDILRRFGHRRPHWVIFVGLAILPVYAAITPMLWLVQKINPLDINSVRRLNQQVTVDGEYKEIRLYASSGDVFRSTTLEIEVRGLSKLMIDQVNGIPNEATISRYNPRHNLYLTRNAAIEEIENHRDLLIQLRRSLEANSSHLTPQVN